MKKLFSLLTMMAVFATLTFAQDTAPAPAAPTTDGPVMEFQSTEIDYGTIEQNSEPYRFFAFTNAGNEPLVIKHAKGSCGCTCLLYTSPSPRDS